MARVTGTYVLPCPLPSPYRPRTAPRARARIGACAPLQGASPMGTPYPTHPPESPLARPHTRARPCAYAHTRI